MPWLRHCPAQRFKHFKIKVSTDLIMLVVPHPGKPRMMKLRGHCTNGDACPTCQSREQTDMSTAHAEHLPTTAHLDPGSSNVSPLPAKEAHGSSKLSASKVKTRLKQWGSASRCLGTHTAARITVSMKPPRAGRSVASLTPCQKPIYCA